MNNVNNYPDKSIDKNNFNPVDGGGTPNCDLTEIFEKTTLETSEGALIFERKITESNEEAQKLPDAYLENGDKKEAAECYSKAAYRRSEAAEAYREGGDKKEAAEYYSKAAYRRSEAAEAYRESGDKKEASHYYRLAAYLYSEAAEAYLESGDKKEAVECYIKASDANEKMGDCFYLKDDIAFFSKPQL